MIAIVDYKAGNTASVVNALDRLNVKSIITNDPNKIRTADKIILPGVGEASSALKQLRLGHIDEVISSATQPLLGICLGLQLMCKSTEEGNSNCFGIFNSYVRKFPSTNKTPHMGWNSFQNIQGTLFNGVEKNDNVYYVHSYYAELCENTIATCLYSELFSAALQRDNYFATQFHPEKSSATGEQILKNFIKL